MILKEGSVLVISIAIVYMLGLVTFAVFLITRKFLRAHQGNEASKAERCLYILSGISLAWMMVLAPIVFVMELVFVFTIPVQNWPQIVEFFNDAETSSVLFFQFPLMFVGIKVMSLVIGYFDYPRRNFDTINAVGDWWLWILLVLYIAVGIAGVFTGLLV
jgi:hypothetical protein